MSRISFDPGQLHKFYTERAALPRWRDGATVLCRSFFSGFLRSPGRSGYLPFYHALDDVPALAFTWGQRIFDAQGAERVGEPAGASGYALKDFEHERRADDDAAVVGAVDFIESHARFRSGAPGDLSRLVGVDQSA